MRSFGLVLLVAGVLAFLYAGSQLSSLPPVPPELDFGESLRYAAGRWDVIRYASGLAALVGVLLALFPKGR